MNIPNSFMTRVSPYPGMENRQTGRKTSQKSAFDKYLDVDRQRQLMGAAAGPDAGFRLHAVHG